MNLYEKSLVEILENLRLEPAGGVEYGDLMGCYINLNRLAEAKAVYPQVLAHKYDSAFFHQQLYAIVFLEGDEVEMSRQLAWAVGKSRLRKAPICPLQHDYALIVATRS